MAAELTNTTRWICMKVMNICVVYQDNFISTESVDVWCFIFGGEEMQNY